MKNSFKILFLVFLFAASSCSESYDLSESFVDEQLMGLGIVKELNSGEFMIHMDNNDLLYPTKNDVPNFSLRDSQRVSVNYSILTLSSNIDNGFDIKINNIAEIPFKNIVTNTDWLTSNESPGRKNDPIIINDVWIVRDFLNVAFQYYGGDEQHFVNVLFQSYSETDNEITASLEFLHNSNNDKAELLTSGISSFNLKSIRKANENHIKIKLNVNEIDKGWVLYDLTYAY